MTPVGPEPLSQLADQHGAALVLYAQQWCGAPEDVVQEVFLRLAQQATAPANVVGWLYRVVRNGAISAGRSARRRSRREAAVARRCRPWFHDAPGDAIDAMAATLALEQLPIVQREIIVARLWGGLSLQEVAELTGSSISTVHRRYEAGLAALREKLGAVCPEKKSTIKT
jgi:RNA polymerase sigma-70 factor (ECF subfamily)